MKTTLTITALLAACIAWAAGDEDATQTQRYEVALDADELVQGVEGLADVLEAKLSGPGRVYYEAAVRRVRICHGIDAIGALLAIVLLSCGIVWCIQRLRRCQGDREDAWGYVFGLGVFAIGIMMCSIMLCQSLSNYLTADYLAMREIIQAATSFVR